MSLQLHPCPTSLRCHDGNRPLVPAARAHRTKIACAPQSASKEPELYVQERGVAFTPGAAFYRAESAQARDLVVLAAAVYKQQTGQLRVLDVMSGSGMRGARYLQQADADMVWCNDYCPDNHQALVYNLAVSSLQLGGSQGQPHQDTSIEAAAEQARGAATEVNYPGIRQPILQWTSQMQQPCAQQHPSIDDKKQVLPADQTSDGFSSGPRAKGCRVSHLEANRLLSAVYLAEDYYDLVDVDSFGCETMHLPAAIDAVKYGGMLYLTSTDGFSSGGKRPERSLAAYGAYLRPLPFANEQGLRMLIGAATKEAATRGVVLQPLFSLYSFHGPVFRVLLRAMRSREWQSQDYGFLGHCYIHSQSHKVPWKQLNLTWCRSCRRDLKEAGAAAGDKQTGILPMNAVTPATASASSSSSTKPSFKAPEECTTPLVLSGPMWTGALHDRSFLGLMKAEAARRGWQGSGIPPNSSHTVRTSRNNRQRPLQELLELLLEEADPVLPPWFLPVDALAQHLTACPSRDKLISALRAAGFVACKCHIEVRALRTNASTADVLRLALEKCCYHLRKDSPYYPLD